MTDQQRTRPAIRFWEPMMGGPATNDAEEGDVGGRPARSGV